MKRYYFIATICDPRQKTLRFPGVTAGERETALAWFEAEYDSHWAPTPVPTLTHTPSAYPLSLLPLLPLLPPLRIRSMVGLRMLTSWQA